MKNKETSLKINTETENRFSVYKAATAFLAMLGFSVAAISAFSSAGISPFFGILPAVLTAVFVFISYKKHGTEIVSIGSLIFAVSVFVLPFLRSGFLLLANDFIKFATERTGKILLEFVISENANPKITILIHLISLGGFLSTAFSRKSVLPVAAVSAVGIFFFGTGFFAPDFWLIIFTTGILSMILLLCFGQNKTVAKSKALLSVLSTVVLCGLLCLAVSVLIPADFADGIKEKTEETAHSVFYDSKTNSMPEGKLSNLDPFEHGDTPALEITMKNPQKLYLKGFVGEVYTGGSWENLPTETLAEYSEEFYWLHKNGFFGQTAVSSALFSTGEFKEKNLSIKNISACSKYAYLPYALSSAKLDERIIGDAATKSFGKSCSVDYIPGGLSEWYMSQVNLSENQDKNEAVSAHLANEAVYRDFVKANYLEIPSDAYDTISLAMEEKTASSATEIISTVLLFLEENITYDEDTYTFCGDEDFITYFLEKNPRGYSVHYSTAATLLLRYFGIPARYAEGYFLSAKEAAEYEENATIVLTEDHAHAWCEYYLEGVGWVPFETTPGYIDDELEKAAFSTEGESSKRYEQSEIPKTDIEHDRPKDKITEAKQTKVLLAVLCSLPVALLIAGIIYIIAMRRKLKKALSDMENSENKVAVPKKFGYAKRILESFEHTDDELEALGYSEAERINRLALFSEHEISDEQRKTVDTYAEKVLLACKEKHKFIEKIKSRFIKFIY